MKKVILSMALMLSSSVTAGTIAEQLVSEKAHTHTKSQHKNMTSASISTIQNSISVNLTQLSDNAGLNYIGGMVATKDLSPYLAQLKARLGDDFSDYRDA